MLAINLVWLNWKKILRKNGTAQIFCSFGIYPSLTYSYNPTLRYYYYYLYCRSDFIYLSELKILNTILANCVNKSIGKWPTNQIQHRKNIPSAENIPVLVACSRISNFRCKMRLLHIRMFLYLDHKNHFKTPSGVYLIEFKSPLRSSHGYVGFAVCKLVIFLHSTSFCRPRYASVFFKQMNLS